MYNNCEYLLIHLSIACTYKWLWCFNISNSVNKIVAGHELLFSNYNSAIPPVNN